MSDQEIRLECLKAAVAEAPHSYLSTLGLAREFYAFVDGREQNPVAIQPPEVPAPF